MEPAKTESTARMTRGLELSKTATIAEREDGSFTVPSQTSPSLSYEVRIIGQAWVCTCPDAMREAIQNSHESKPERILTDAHKSYKDGIEIAFGSDRPQHIAKMGVGKPHANNNRMERTNGTLRERVKVQRGWKSMRTPLAEGQRIQYNFVRPHMALDGQTPAQAAGVGLGGKNKWMEMLREAVSENQRAT